MSLTDEFVEAFADTVDFDGAYFRLMDTVGVPLGVNDSDPRVQDILTRCREWQEKAGKS